MTLRTKSRFGQWMVWLCGVLALLAAYVIFSRCFFNVVSWNVCDPRAHRLMLSLAVVFIYFARETRWAGPRQEEPEASLPSPVPVAVPSSAQLAVPVPQPAPAPVLPAQPNPQTDSRPAPSSQFLSQPSPQFHPYAPVSDFTGEELYAQARAIPHQEIPDFEVDGVYLDLLGQSAAKGYAPAMTKLGEYALRRAAWVEAYYWISMAKRKGGRNLEVKLREIRKEWSLNDFPDQSRNVNHVFSFEAGSIGRALLHLDSGHEAASAREFLKAHYPEFL